MAGKKKRKTNSATEILHRRYIKGDPRQMEALVRERVKSTIAQMIYDLRTQAGLTQAQLARKIGTTASAISRLEDADYQGQSLNTLIKIASAMHHDIEINLVPA